MTQSALRVLRHSCRMMNFLTLNFYIMMKRFLLLTLLLSFWGLASAWAVEPVSGKMYYIYCHQKNGSDQWFYYNSSNQLSVSDSYVPKSNDYLFLCTITTASDGVTKQYQFKSLKGNYYLWHSGLGSGNTFTLDTGTTNSTADSQGNTSYYGPKSTNNDKYFVMKNDGTKDQATRQYYDNSYSSNFQFVEYEFPKAGETYYIYADTYVNNAFVPRFVYHDSGTTTLGNTTSVADVTSNNKYKWVCEASTTDGQWYFKNLATGKYMKHKGVQDARAMLNMLRRRPFTQLVTANIW